MSFCGLHQKSARHLLEIFPESRAGKYKLCVDVTITSPPYWNLKNYGFEGQIGHGQSYEKYLEDLRKIFADVYLITKNTGSLWIIIDTFKKKKRDSSLDSFENGELVPLPYDVMQKAKDSGWKLRDVFIWKKDKTLPWSRKGQLRNIFEYILFFSKTDDFNFHINRIRVSDSQQLKEWWVKYPERYNPNGAVPTDIWEFNIPVQGKWARSFLRHFCPFPVALVERILLLTTNKGNTVLDPFAGSGVVLAVADSLERQYIGFELNSDYIDMFHEHVLEDVRQEIDSRKKFWRQLRRLQYNLKETINRLRLTKYPKILVRRMYHKGLISKKALSINTIFAIKRKMSQDELKGSKWKFLKEDVYLVFEDLPSMELYQQVLNLSSVPPLSKFGIEPTFHFMSRNMLIEKEKSKPTFDHKHLWLYRKGVMNKFYRQLEFEEWEDLSAQDSWKMNFRNGVPPIMSNVRVSQPVVKSWQPRGIDDLS